MSKGGGRRGAAEDGTRRAEERGRRERRRARRFRRGRRRGHLYRDRDRGRLLGVCAGIADYLGRPVWEIRLYVILGLLFMWHITVPAYCIAYFLMDEKPYYRRVTDRFEESPRADRRTKGRAGESSDLDGDAASAPKGSRREHALSNVQALRIARRKFDDIERRLRRMETCVTSSKFELQRELSKIS